MEAKPVALTSRKGDRICFRSTLEARWAYYFDCLGFEWHYEPFRFKLNSGFTYTPDFEVTGIGLIEVKPGQARVDESIGRIRLFLEQSKVDRVYLFCGGDPFHAEVSILAGCPLREVFVSWTQRNLILAGRQRWDLAKKDYLMLCDTINIALKAASAPIVTDLLTAGEKMALTDTRDKTNMIRVA